MINANPVVHKVSKAVLVPTYEFSSEDSIEQLSREEIFDKIRHLNDPEHPLTLEQLKVVQSDHITIVGNNILIQFTPTIPHCSMATLIGLCIRVKLLRTLPSRYKSTVQIFPGTHQSEDAVNRQLNDKERVAAALENSHLLDIVNKCILNSDP